MADDYIWGTGRRKSAVARVRIRPGEGEYVINGLPIEKFFPLERHQATARGPLGVTNMNGRYDVFVNIGGGGITGQAGAASLGLARALAKADQTCEDALRSAGLLTRDSRMKERKKYGLRGARRGYQFSKR